MNSGNSAYKADPLYLTKRAFILGLLLVVASHVFNLDYFEQLGHFLDQYEAWELDELLLFLLILLPTFLVDTYLYHSAWQRLQKVNETLAIANIELVRASITKDKFISKREKTQEEVQEISRRLSLATNAAKIGIWDYDFINNRLYWDDRMYELYGIDVKDFGEAYETWQQCVHPEDLPAAHACLQAAIPSDAGFHTDFRVIWPDGQIRYIEAHALILRDEHGVGQRMIGVNWDITDRKLTQTKIERYAERLETSNRELEAFAYSVSHDLRAPLRAIDGFSKALLEDYGELFTEEGKDYFDRICKNVSLMGQLIDDLLHLSRVSRLEIQYTKVNLSRLAQEIIEELQLSESKRQVEVLISPEITISADITLMRVIMSNLLHNAWKFTSHHSTARIEFGVDYSETSPTYYVRDNGVGFDMAYANMLFGVFQRLHSTEEFPGTGIGLATVQRAIFRHNGSIWAESALGQGTTFFFKIPEQLPLN